MNLTLDALKKTLTDTGELTQRQELAYIYESLVEKAKFCEVWRREHYSDGRQSDKSLAVDNWLLDSSFIQKVNNLLSPEHLYFVIGEDTIYGKAGEGDVSWRHMHDGCYSMFLYRDPVSGDLFSVAKVRTFSRYIVRRIEMKSFGHKLSRHIKPATKINELTPLLEHLKSIASNVQELQTKLGTPNYIVGVACMSTSGKILTLPRPHRHSHLINMYCEDNKSIYSDVVGTRHSDEGFITRDGKYLTREDAWEVAKASGQILRDQNTYAGENSGFDLHSEHLY